MLTHEEELVFKLEDISPKLKNVAIKKFYNKDEIIISQGEIFKGVYIIITGKVIVHSFSVNGRKKTHAILEPFSSIGGTHSIVLYESPFQLECLSNVELLFIDREKLIDVFKKDFEESFIFFKTANVMINTYVYQAGESTFFDSEAKICKLLISLANNYGIKKDDKIKINFDLSIKFICDIVGVNKLTVIRSFNKLKELNLIEKNNGYYYITNLNELNKLL